jgi:hypothetical protein
MNKISHKSALTESDNINFKLNTIHLRHNAQHYYNVTFSQVAQKLYFSSTLDKKIVSISMYGNAYCVFILHKVGFFIFVNYSTYN